MEENSRGEVGGGEQRLSHPLLPRSPVLSSAGETLIRLKLGSKYVVIEYQKLFHSNSVLKSCAAAKGWFPDGFEGAEGRKPDSATRARCSTLRPEAIRVEIRGRVARGVATKG